VHELTDFPDSTPRDSAQLQRVADDLYHEPVVIGSEDLDDADDTAAQPYDDDIDTSGIGSEADLSAGDQASDSVDTPESAPGRAEIIADAVSEIALGTELVADEPVDQASEAADTPTEAATDPEAGETAPSREAIISEFDKFQHGETVTSESGTVGEFPLSDREKQTLTEIAARNSDYTTIGHDKLSPEGRIDKTGTGMTKGQLRTIAEIGDRFIETVNQDGAANGYGSADPESLYARVGHFEPRYDSLNWHVDPFNSPTVRYALSLGEVGATMFAHGPIHQTQVSRNGHVSNTIQPTPGGTHEPVSHDNGVVSRFMAGTSIHRSPTDGGFRVFFTVDIPLFRDEEP
jgi:hypothetical protein